MKKTQTKRKKIEERKKERGKILDHKTYLNDNHI